MDKTTEKEEEEHEKKEVAEMEQPTLVGEVKSLILLAIPLFLSSASWVGMKTTDTALLGHLEESGTLYLSAVAVADLWTSSTGVFIQGRVLGVFVGHAVGAGRPEMAGVWLQVSLTCLAPLALVPLLLWSSLTSTIIPTFTSDTELVAPGALHLHLHPDLHQEPCTRASWLRPSLAGCSTPRPPST